MVAVNYRLHLLTRPLPAGCSLLFPLLFLFIFGSPAMQSQDSRPRSVVSLKLSISGTFPGNAVVQPPRENSGDDGEEPVLYPADAVKEGVEGTVKLKMLIGADGTIKELQTLDSGGDPRLLQAAVEGFRNAGFAPGSVDGKLTDMWVMVEVKFSAGGEYRPGEEREEEEIEGPTIMKVDEMTPEEPVEPTAAPIREYELEDFVPDVIEATYSNEELMSLLEYPAKARRNNIQGRVIVSVQVSPTGEVLKIVVRDASDSVFIEPSVNAVQKLHFTPAYQKGKPIKMWKTFAIFFSLD